MQSNYLISAILEVGETSIHIFPIRTTGQFRLHLELRRIHKQMSLLLATALWLALIFRYESNTGQTSISHFELG